MGDQEHSLQGSAAKSSQLGLHNLARLGIKRRERLVEQQDFRIDSECARHVDTLTHTARKLVRKMALEATELGQINEALRGRLRFRLGDAGQCQSRRRRSR